MHIVEPQLHEPVAGNGHRDEAGEKTQVFPPAEESSPHAEEANQRNLGDQKATEIADAAANVKPISEGSANENPRHDEQKSDGRIASHCLMIDRFAIAAFPPEANLWCSDRRIRR